MTEGEQEGKVVLVHVIKACCGGVAVKLHSFLTSYVDEGEWSPSRPGRFIHGKELLYTEYEA